MPMRHRRQRSSKAMVTKSSSWSREQDQGTTQLGALPTTALSAAACHVTNINIQNDIQNLTAIQINKSCINSCGGLTATGFSIYQAVVGLTLTQGRNDICICILIMDTMPWNFRQIVNVYPLFHGKLSEFHSFYICFKTDEHRNIDKRH